MRGWCPVTAPQGTYEGQLAQRVAELLPDVDLDARLELLGVMDPDDMRTSLAFIVSQYPQMFDFALVRDSKLVERLQDQLDHQYDDEPEPYCSACGADLGIFAGRQAEGWLHYSGQGTAAAPVQIFEAGHDAAVAWREAGAL